MKCSSQECSCPTYNRDLAEVTLRCIDRDISGVLHCTGPDSWSKIQWAHKVVSHLF